MKCGVCERYTQRISCVECARAGLWGLRMRYLLESSVKESTVEKVHEYLESPAGILDLRKTPKDRLQNKIVDLRAETARLKLSLEADKVSLSASRKEADLRKKRLKALRESVQRQESIFESIQREIKRQNQKWKSLYNRTAEARSFLSREAAGIYGLRIKRRKSGRVDYLIGGVPIPNLLADLNVQSFVSINTSIEHLSRLVVLVSYYCGLKLPNEIILPGSGNPSTSIRGPLFNRHLATRRLHVETAFGVLSRENPTVHGKYIEGISMLVMNIAWLCFSQGLEVNSVEEACNIGQSMWKLLVAKDSTALNNSTFGRTSHATANGNLTTQLGQTLMSGFTLAYISIVEKIRYTLQVETIVADWDLVPEAQMEARPPDKNTTTTLNDDQNDKSDSAVGPLGVISYSGFGEWTRIKSRTDNN